MILQFDTAGNLIATVHEVYPAPKDALVRMADQGYIIVDMPPVEPAYWHYRDGEIKIKKMLDIKSFEDENLVRLEGIPKGAHVVVTGDYQGVDISDGEGFEIEFSQSGSYVIQIMAKDFQPFHYSVIIP